MGKGWSLCGEIGIFLEITGNRAIDIISISFPVYPGSVFDLEHRFIIRGGRM